MARSINRPAAVIGLCLITMAMVIGYDTLLIGSNTVYGLGPQAMPVVVATGLVLLGIGHIALAIKGGEAAGDHDPIDPVAVGLLVAGLLALIICIGAGAGFIPAMTLLFGFTATAFGRRTYAVDFGIGLVLSVVVYLLFTKLLTLSLPQGPLERLIG